MEIVYTLRYSDFIPTWVAMRRVHRAQPRQSWAILSLFVFLASIGVLALSLASFRHGRHGGFDITLFLEHLTLLAGAVIAGPILGWLFSYAIWRTTSPRTVRASVSSEGVQWITHRNELTFAWTSLRNVSSDAEGVVFSRILSRDNRSKWRLVMAEPPLAVVVPRHAFASTAQMDEFYTLAQRYWLTAQMKDLASLDGEQVWPPPPRVGA